LKEKADLFWEKCYLTGVKKRTYALLNHKKVKTLVLEDRKHCNLQKNYYFYQIAGILFLLLIFHESNLEKAVY